MGDRVERALEETVPLLRTVRKLKLLSESEVRSIVQKRRDHEYALRRPQAPRSIFLRYAAFEKHVTELIQDRARTRNLPEKRARNVVGQQSARVNLIYSRAIRKFKGDDKLYLHYAKHCIATGSRKAAQKVLARAIAFRGDSERVWLAAIAFHFDACGDTKVARVLALRALRTLRSSKDLWKEYFRLELIYIARLVARRMTIGANIYGDSSDAADGDTAGSPDTGADDADEEAAQMLVPGGVSKDQEAKLGFWHGGVPFAVFRNAEKEANLELKDAAEYLTIARSIKLTPPELIKCLYHRILKSYGQSSPFLASFLGVRMPYDVASAQLKRQREIVRAGISSSDGKAKRLDIEVVAGSERNSAGKADRKLQHKLLAGCKEQAGKTVSEMERLLCSKAPQTFVDGPVCDNVRNFMACIVEDVGSATAKNLCARCERILEMNEVDQNTDDEAELSVDALRSSKAASLWTKFLKGPGMRVWENDNKVQLEVVRECLRSVTAVPFRDMEVNAICVAWLRWERDVASLRTAYDLLCRLPPLTRDLVVAAIDAEMRLAQLTDETNSSGQGGTCPDRITVERIRSLYAKGLSIASLTKDVDFWLEYVGFERDIAKNPSLAAEVQWKAKHVLSLEFFTVFDERLLLRNVMQA